MKIIIETENLFYFGWLCHFMEQPRDTIEEETFQDGWDMGHETAPLDKASQEYKNLLNQASLGRLYMAFLASRDAGHYWFKIER